MFLVSTGTCRCRFFAAQRDTHRTSLPEYQGFVAGLRNDFFHTPRQNHDRPLNNGSADWHQPCSKQEVMTRSVSPPAGVAMDGMTLETA